MTTAARTALRALTLLAALLALVVASPAAAAKSCGERVIDDWYDDGRVDGEYPLHCYDDAIEALPRDVLDYSSARDDIQRALQAVMRGEEPPPARTDPTPSNGNGPDDAPDDEPADEPGSTGPTETTPGTGGGSGDPNGGGPEAAPPTDTESASSIPIPLLVLAGLALLLVAGGSAGYLLRRLQARRVPPPVA